MKIIFCVLWCYICLSSPGLSIDQLLLGVGEPNSPISESLDEEYLFRQKLDHFNSNDSRIWYQRFNVNEQFYQEGGPAFLLIIGAEPKSNRWMHSGAWIEYAQEFKAICFQLEHRYYGKSHPTENLNNNSLEYLNSKQALADLAYFISFFKISSSFKSPKKWVVFGGSYAGSLAAWLRLKYPNLVNTAVSSSGPLVAKADFKEYFKSIENTLKAYSPNCAMRIKVAYMLINNMLDTDDGAEMLRKRFNFCDGSLNRNNKKQVSNFFSSLAYSIAEIVQYNNVNRYYDYPVRRTASVESLCDDINDDSNLNLVDAYAIAVKVNRKLLSLNKLKNGCISSYESLVESYSLPYWRGETSNERQWKYQSCTEFGFYQTSNQDSSAFGQKFPLDYFTSMCSDIFGKSFNSEILSSGIENTNNIYGGLNVSDDRTIFVYGSNDPWLTLGVARSNKKSRYSVFIKGTSHCADMYPSSSDDSPQLKEARQKIKTFLKELLDCTL